MNYIFKIGLITLCLLNVNLFPQEKDINYSSDGFIYTLNLGNEPYKIEGLHKKIISHSLIEKTLRVYQGSGPTVKAFLANQGK